MAQLSNVFDLYFPSPPPLKELSCIQVALDVWIGEIKTNCMASDIYYPDIDSILPLKTLIPNAPSSILSEIENYAKVLEISINDWLKIHINKKIFTLKVLRKFTRFVCDFNGRVDSDRTAKRMLRCDAFDAEVKFKIACEYGFVDDIARIWPQVESNIFENYEYPKRNIEELYWIWHFRGQLYKLNGLERGDPLGADGFIFDKYLQNGRWFGVNHFWNRFDQRFSSRIIDKIFEKPRMVFRYILVKLNEEQLQRLVNEKGDQLVDPDIYREYGIRSRFPSLALRIWNYIKHVMNEDVFIRLIRHMISKVSDTSPYATCYSVEVQSEMNEIWKTAPDQLKRAAIPDVLLTNFTYRTHGEQYHLHSKTVLYHSVSFLFTLLEDFPIHFRRVFWDRHWRALIVNLELNDLEKLINMCFENENEIVQFKEREINPNENFRPFCLSLMNSGCFKELLDYLRFFCTGEETSRSVAQTLLMNNFQWSMSCLKQPRALNEFINFTFANDTEFVEQIRNNLIKLTSTTIADLLKYIDAACFSLVRDFVDTFVTSRKDVVDLKRREIVPRMRTLISRGFDYSSVNNPNIMYQSYITEGFSEFMNWCLENDDEIARFKQSLNLDEIIQLRLRRQALFCVNRIPSILDIGFLSMKDECRCDFNKVRLQRLKNKFNTKPTTRSFLASFIKWYCASPEDVEKVKTKYAGDYTFIKMMTDSGIGSGSH